MSFVINTNVMSLVAQQNLDKSNNMLNQAITRLSSGKKINSAADDAAGQAISNRMSAQISGLSQAKSNANDGISLGQTTEGALDQINDNLQRIRVLSVQAANGTYSDSDLASMQEEIDERLNEIDRVSAQTTFNGVNVLAEDQSLRIQVGDNDDETISINLSKITSGTLGLSALDMKDQHTTDGLTELGGDGDLTAFGTTAEFDGITFDGNGVDFSGWSAVVTSDGTLVARSSAAGDFYNATYDADTNTLSVDTAATVSATAATAASFVAADGNVYQLSDVNDSGIMVSTASAPSYTLHQGSDGALYVVDGSDNYWKAGSGASINTTTGVITLGTADGDSTAWAAITQHSITATDLMTTAASAVTIDMGTIDTNLGGTNTLVQADDGDYLVAHVEGSNTTYYHADVDEASGAVTLQTDADGNNVEAIVDPLKALDNALSQVDTLRSNLGAMQNRFDSAIANLSTTNTNLKAARSRIVDANYAEVVSSLSKSQILQQAGTAVLSQANQSQQSVLSLLR